MKIELMFPEKIILTEISDKKATQKDVAMTYRIIIQQKLKVDWKKINKAIVDRWSRAGLERVKNLAWSGKCFN